MKEDSLKKVMTIDVPNGDPLGEISSVNFDDKSIYILEKEIGN